MLVKELRDRNYEAFPPKGDEKKAKSNEDEADDAEDEDAEVAGGVRDYDYLLSVCSCSLPLFVVQS